MKKMSKCFKYDVLSLKTPHLSGFFLCISYSQAKMTLGIIPKLEPNFFLNVDGRVLTEIYDKSNDFDFEIVGFLFFSSNLPFPSSRGVAISK